MNDSQLDLLPSKEVKPKLLNVLDIPATQNDTVKMIHVNLSLPQFTENDSKKRSGKIPHTVWEDVEPSEIQSLNKENDYLMKNIEVISLPNTKYPSISESSSHHSSKAPNVIHSSRSLQNEYKKRNPMSELQAEVVCDSKPEYAITPPSDVPIAPLSDIGLQLDKGYSTRAKVRSIPSRSITNEALKSTKEGFTRIHAGKLESPQRDLIREWRKAEAKGLKVYGPKSHSVNAESLTNKRTSSGDRKSPPEMKISDGISTEGGSKRPKLRKEEPGDADKESEKQSKARHYNPEEIRKYISSQRTRRIEEKAKKEKNDLQEKDRIEASLKELKTHYSEKPKEIPPRPDQPLVPNLKHPDLNANIEKSMKTRKKEEAIDSSNSDMNFILKKLQNFESKSDSKNERSKYYFESHKNGEIIKPPEMKNLTENKYQNSDSQNRNFDSQKQNFDSQKHNFDSQKHNFDSQKQNFDPQNKVSDFENKKFDFKNRKIDTQNQKMDSRSQKFDSKNSKLHSKNKISKSKNYNSDSDSLSDILNRTLIECESKINGQVDSDTENSVFTSESSFRDPLKFVDRERVDRIRSLGQMAQKLASTIDNEDKWIDSNSKNQVLSGNVFSVDKDSKITPVCDPTTENVSLEQLILKMASILPKSDPEVAKILKRQVNTDVQSDLVIEHEKNDSKAFKESTKVSSRTQNMSTKKEDRIDFSFGLDLANLKPLSTSPENHKPSFCGTLNEPSLKRPDINSLLRGMGLPLDTNVDGRHKNQNIYPENDAATTIQSCFRGYQTRKQISPLLSHQTQPQEPVSYPFETLLHQTQPPKPVNYQLEALSHQTQPSKHVNYQLETLSQKDLPQKPIRYQFGPLSSLDQLTIPSNLDNRESEVDWRKLEEDLKLSSKIKPPKRVKEKSNLPSHVQPFYDLAQTGNIEEFLNSAHTPDEDIQITDKNSDITPILRKSITSLDDMRRSSKEFSRKIEKETQTNFSSRSKKQTEKSRISEDSADEIDLKNYRKSTSFKHTETNKNLSKNILPSKPSLFKSDCSLIDKAKHVKIMDFDSPTAFSTQFGPKDLCSPEWLDHTLEEMLIATASDFNKTRESYNTLSDKPKTLTNQTHLSPSKLTSSLNAELLYQDTINSALSHLEDLENLRNMSNIEGRAAEYQGTLKTLHHHNKELETEVNQLRERTQILSNDLNTKENLSSSIKRVELEAQRRLQKLEYNFRKKTDKLFSTSKIHCRNTSRSSGELQDSMSSVSSKVQPNFSSDNVITSTRIHESVEYSSDFLEASQSSRSTQTTQRPIRTLSNQNSLKSSNQLNKGEITEESIEEQDVSQNLDHINQEESIVEEIEDVPLQGVSTKSVSEDLNNTGSSNDKTTGHSIEEDISKVSGEQSSIQESVQTNANITIISTTSEVVTSVSSHISVESSSSSNNSQQKKSNSNASSNKLSPEYSCTYSESFEPDSQSSDASQSFVASKIHKTVIEMGSEALNNASIVEALHSQTTNSIKESPLSLLQSYPKKSNLGALQYTLRYLENLQKEGDIRLSHQKTSFKIQEQLLIEEANAKLSSLTSDGAVNVRKKQRAILMQLREQRSHLKRLLEAQELAAQQNRITYAQIYQLLSSTCNIGSTPGRFLTRGQSPNRPLDVTLSSSDGTDNIITKKLRSLTPSSDFVEKIDGLDQRENKSQTSNQEVEFDLKKFAVKNRVINKVNDSVECSKLEIEHNKMLEEERDSSSVSVASIPEKTSSDNEYTTKSNNFEDTAKINSHSTLSQPLPSTPNEDMDADALNTSQPLNSEPIVDDLANKNQTEDHSKQKAKSGVPFTLRFPLSPRSHLRHRFSSESDDSFTLSQNETASDISDGDGRLLALQEELSRRKSEAERLKKEKKRIRRERMATQEAALRKQIEALDNYIRKTKLEIEESTNVEVHPTSSVKPLIKKPRVGSNRKITHDQSITSDHSEILNESNENESSKLDSSIQVKQIEDSSSLSSNSTLKSDVTLKEMNHSSLTTTSQSEQESLTPSNDKNSKLDLDKVSDVTGPELVESDLSASFESSTETILHSPKKSIDKNRTIFEETIQEFDNETQLKSSEQSEIKQIYSEENSSSDSTTTLSQNLTPQVSLPYESQLESTKVPEQVEIKPQNTQSKDESPVISEHLDMPQETSEKVLEEIKEPVKSYSSNKVNKVADTILNSLVAESVKCIKNLFTEKERGVKDIVVTVTGPPDNDVKTENTALVVNKDNLKTHSDESSSRKIPQKGLHTIFEDHPLLTNEIKSEVMHQSGSGTGDVTEKYRINSPVESTDVESSQSGVCPEDLASRLLGVKQSPATSTPSVFDDVPRTPEDENFQVASFEGAWLDGDFWKSGETTVASQTYLREEEELLNAEIARIEELERFKKQYPDLIIREVPNKPPPPYTPPKDTSPVSTPMTLTPPPSPPVSTPVVSPGQPIYPQPQTQANTISVPHRLSKADLRRMASEIANVVASGPEEVEECVHSSVDLFYDEWFVHGRDPSLLTHDVALKKSSEDKGNSEAIQATFERLLFEVCRDIVAQVYAHHHAPPPRPYDSAPRPRPHSKLLQSMESGSKDRLRRYVVSKVRVLIGFDSFVNRPSTMMKWTKKKKEKVDQILLEELHAEEENWTHYGEEETRVKIQLSNDVFNSLIDDSVTVIRNIMRKKQLCS